MTFEKNSLDYLEKHLISSLIRIRREVGGILGKVSCIGFLITENLAYSSAHCLVEAFQTSDITEIDRQKYILRVQTQNIIKMYDKKPVNEISSFIS